MPVTTAAGRKRAIVRSAVTDSTTAASGTRLLIDALDPVDDQVEAGKNLLGQRLGRGEATQVITWTEALRWPVSPTVEGQKP